MKKAAADKAPAKAQAEAPGFEDALKRLTAIVERLESGELSLEQSLSLFEEGTRLSRSSQSCALGSAVSATVAAGVHPDFKTAQAAMTALKEITYTPIPGNQAIYEKLYALYRELHDAFGGVTPSADLGHVMARKWTTWPKP